MIEIRLGCALALLLAFSAGCLGGDTGTEGEMAYCGDRGVAMALGPDDETPHGTPRALTALAQGELRKELRFWTPNGDDEPPTARTTQVSIALTIDLASARLVAYEQRGRPEVVCEPEIELDALLRLETSDGTFAEQVTGRVTMKSSGGVIAGFFGATLALADQRGSYPAREHPDLESFQVVMHLQVDTSHDADAAPDWSGHITLSYRSSPGRQYGTRYVAEW